MVGRIIGVHVRQLAAVRPSARARALASASNTRTRIPARANTMTQPNPTEPAPTIPTVLISRRAIRPASYADSPKRLC
jgi:hypothetical protein